ncbi:MAG: hypothetical protein AAB373_05225 [Patescibacteria group bacterium]
MENKQLLNLSIKYGLSGPQIEKVANIVYQAGIMDSTSKEFARISNYLCEAKIIHLPEEEIIEELKLKGIIKD